MVSQILIHVLLSVVEICAAREGHWCDSIWDYFEARDVCISSDEVCEIML